MRVAFLQITLADSIICRIDITTCRTSLRGSIAMLAARSCRLAPLSACDRLGPCLAATLMAATLLATTAAAQENRFEDYPPNVKRYLQRIYGEDQQPLAFRGKNDAAENKDFQRWQTTAREELRRRLGLPKIAQTVGDHQPTVTLQAPEDQGTYYLQRGEIETEPDVHLAFFLLKPKGQGPWPLALFPHGHSTSGHFTSAGVYSDEAHRKRTLAEDRDVAVQAVRQGFLAIAPAVRGLSADGVPDINNRHGNRACRSHVMHCLLAGRTASGERVWDMQRLIDWAQSRPDVDASHVLMMGNSGGGMVTLFAAACDERITVAVPSCSFAPTVNQAGYIFHCDCNMVPGLMELGGMATVAGLIAPRHLLAVNGRTDQLFSNQAIEDEAAKVKAIYEAAGHGHRFQHRFGEGGHRFYADLMWPFVRSATGLE